MTYNDIVKTNNIAKQNKSIKKNKKRAKTLKKEQIKYRKHKKQDQPIYWADFFYLAANKK